MLGVGGGGAARSHASYTLTYTLGLNDDTRVVVRHNVGVAVKVDIIGMK